MGEGADHGGAREVAALPFASLNSGRTPLRGPELSVAAVRMRGVRNSLGVLVVDDVVVAELARCVPGADSAARLAGLAGAVLSAAGRVDALVAVERHLRWLQAIELELLAGLEAQPLECIPGQPDALVDFLETGEQVACALRVSPDTARGRLVEARAIVSRFPRTVALLAQGRIQLMHAKVLSELTANLDDPVATRVEELTVDRFPQQTVGAARKAIARAVIKADPVGAEERHRRAGEDRHTALQPRPDGMAWYGALLTAVDALRVDAAVDTHARRSDDGRTLRQRRADALVDLVTRPGELVHESGTTSPVTTVSVTVPYDTLIGTGQDPADLKGYGPITAAQARALATAPGSIWRRLLVEPATGRLVRTDPTSYRPTAEVARHVTARDATCRFPGCTRAADQCDLDHVVPFNHDDPRAGGPTTPDNLIALCRRHHLLKHRARWRVRHDPATHDVHWTSPTRHHYTSSLTAAGH